MTSSASETPIPTSAATMDPFKSHLVALLSIYELGPLRGAPIPRYEGPSDWQTETILRSLSAIAGRMWAAEQVIADFKEHTGQFVSLVDAVYLGNVF